MQLAALLASKSGLAAYGEVSWLQAAKTETLYLYELDSILYLFLLKFLTASKNVVLLAKGALGNCALRA